MNPLSVRQSSNDIHRDLSERLVKFSQLFAFSFFVVLSLLLYIIIIIIINIIIIVINIIIITIE